ncbi:MAG: S26 family signal peptidase, partial [Phycisphaerales bacterium]|nr:S26 family signal peptidase [Phycisphaerales bacterium]
MSDGTTQPHPESSIIETFQSLIVAFVLAMTFRGFVTEGFVIPTGSMAPTLLGQHQLVHSEQTGITFPVGLDQSATSPGRNVANLITDPMVGPQSFGSAGSNIPLNRRMGDRILVLKCLYPFAMPKRFDVVVFKNPTDPVGEAANYIKRLIGLPNEQIWLADGDVFARPEGEDEFHIQRKPEHVQRAVWQMVHHSDYVPINPDRLIEQTGRRYEGLPWMGDSEHWNFDRLRQYECTTADPAVLTWDSSRRPLTDWTPYNMMSRSRYSLNLVSDVRISAGLVARQAGLRTTLEIEARSHLFQFIVADGKAMLRMRPLNDQLAWVEVESSDVHLPQPGKVFNVEFWHVDQSMRLFIDGEEVVEPLNYDWPADERLRNATGMLGARGDDLVRLLKSDPVSPAQVRWRFEGSPVTLHRVRVDRDLFYRRDALMDSQQQQKNPPSILGPAFGTNPFEKLRVPEQEGTLENGWLDEDQFMMCGDNSQASLDSRLWGNPHPLVKEQIDPSPFVVNRKL